MTHEIAPKLDVEILSSKDAPLMLHEQVASGDYGGRDFRAIRDVTGLHWQIQIGETTARFSLNSALQEIVTQTVDQKL